MAVNIKKIVGHLGLSEEQIAEQLCVEVSYLKSLENDEQKLSQDMIHKFADLCDVPTSYFMNNFRIPLYFPRAAMLHIECRHRYLQLSLYLDESTDKQPSPHYGETQCICENKSTCNASALWIFS